MARRTVRIDIRNVWCVDNDDEIGIAERDELYFLIAGVMPDGSTFKRCTKTQEGVDEDEWAFREGVVMAQAELEQGALLEAVAVLMERDGGSPQDLLGVLGQAVETTLSTGSIEAALVETALDFGVKQVLERGGDDVLGAVRIRVTNVEGEIRKVLTPLKRTKIGGHGALKSLSKSGMTVRTEMYHNAAANNVVHYLTSFNVRDVARVSAAHPEGMPFTWALANGRAY